MKKILLLLVVSIFAVQSVLASDLDYEHGYFKRITTSPANPRSGTAYKLKDGRVFIRRDGRGIIRIFDPKTDSFVLANCFCSGYGYCSVTLLEDESLLVTGVYYFYPAFHYRTDIEKFLEKEGVKYPYQHIRGWDKLPFDERVQRHLSYIKRNPKLYEDYKNYAKEYEESMYAQICTNMETKECKRTGKLNIRRGLFGHVLLNDGTVLFFGGGSYEYSAYVDEQEKQGKDWFDLASQFEIYNPKTGEFKLIDTYASLGFVNKAFLLNDGRVFIVSSKEHSSYNYPQNQTQEFSIYNPKTGEVFRSKEKFNGIALVKLPDDRILYTNRIDDITKTKESENSELISGLRIYDPKTDKVVYSGKSLIPRSHDSQLTVLPNGTVMISGGVNYNRFSIHYRDPERRVEIFNPTTGEIKIIRPRLSDGYYSDSVLLDDGRILFYDDYSAELYIPKGYKEKVKLKN